MRLFETIVKQPNSGQTTLGHFPILQRHTRKSGLNSQFGQSLMLIPREPGVVQWTATVAIEPGNKYGAVVRGRESRQSQLQGGMWKLVLLQWINTAH